MGAANVVFMPLLILMFVGLVAYSLTLPGAMTGLNTLFSPDWGALANGQVWVAAYGQIFFSLSIGFGIMVTYASYLKPKTDLTGSGTVVGFANSGFELLAGIGVFAALGFMAQAQGVAVGKVVEEGTGLAFIAFPTIISQAPAGRSSGSCSSAPCCSPGSPRSSRFLRSLSPACRIKPVRHAWPRP